MSNAGERATQASAQRRREHFSTDSLTPEMTETADTYFGFGNKHHLGDWQRRHSLFFLPVVTPQTLGRHAQTRADLADTRRHARSHAHRPRKRQARVRHVHTRRDHTLGFRQEAGKSETRSLRQEAQTTHLASGKRQARGEASGKASGKRQARHVHTRRDHSVSTRCGGSRG